MRREQHSNALFASNYFKDEKKQLLHQAIDHNQFDASISTKINTKCTK